jgi:heptosyltransferase-3
MGRVLERVPAGARVAVIRLRSMGDCILTTPALAILKQGRRDLSVGADEVPAAVDRLKVAA